MNEARMDPNVTLTEIRAAVVVLGAYQKVFDQTSSALCEQLAEQITALDNWLCNGGFLPDDWARPRAVAN